MSIQLCPFNGSMELSRICHFNPFFSCDHNDRRRMGDAKTITEIAIGLHLRSTVI